MRGSVAALFLALLPFGAALAQTEGLPPDRAIPPRMAAPQRQMLGTVLRNAGTAQQLAAIAGARGGGRLDSLAHAMAQTNGRLAQGLAQVAGAENMPLRERLDDAALARLRALAAGDHARFGQELVGWITRHYPDTITGIETLARTDPRFDAVAAAAVPSLREQLTAAQQLAQAALEEGGQGAH